ncbi:MAG: NADH-quinone oxidoreductase subunit NuoE [Candidatus Bipolaricaulota bacterium]
MIPRELEQRISPILARYAGKKGVVVPLLQDVQGELGYLPAEAMQVIAEELPAPLARLYGVASFYSQFYFQPRGKHVVRVCTGTACYIRGAGDILARLAEELKIRAGETTPDLTFTLETVNCVGCCALAPVVVVDDRVLRKRDHKKLWGWIRQERR